MKKIFIFTLILLVVCISAFAQNRSSSLNDVKTSRVIFDVNIGDAKLLLTRLTLIKETLDGLSKYNDYKAVVAFRGKASNFVTKNNEHIKKDDIGIKEKIYSILNILKNDYNATLEQCTIALKFAGIEPDEVYDIINVIENGYISIIGYQNQGYAFVPMD
ncbi:DsrE family protein [Deferribacterales bacterium Es71-Z0220]|jgi:intracellular sulfur oxidation DsrE/DsrF family protein|uniref:DsrE family protein n=1 Tax=Deferrivibrio essentukiensis TaxID=2880922 RepID=UPI001F61CB46|nr:DsrE family protein [Deferrivibrio essentukiensis]MBZ4642837.1 hypothetical protein [Deferribacteraceae bacterium]MCB4204841.1 DsrE family protein [Deferrivibrio essentukiensis]MDK2792024.1 hypothetical protein [Deferribacteres bacterium]